MRIKIVIKPKNLHFYCIEINLIIYLFLKEEINLINETKMLQISKIISLYFFPRRIRREKKKESVHLKQYFPIITLIDGPQSIVYDSSQNYMVKMSKAKSRLDTMNRAEYAFDTNIFSLFLFLLQSKL